ncbi:MAG TPA: glycosyltransferase family 1 protein [Candidatus Moranbacteria bacterium]|nr:glycosyltransferase family 1 protein [Candidatus Moranbacteria bacterium]
MKIAIQSADLDNSRIDGTRVYLWNVLKYLGKLSSQDDFFIYHKADFNPELRPVEFSNYKIKKIWSPALWTQTKFALEIWRDKIDILWMPMHNIPLIKSKKMKTVVTIHDLAFKRFPKTFPKKDLYRLNFLTDLAVKNSDKIIAVSNSTKNDILKFYPKISEGKIKVIYHGFDAELFQKIFSAEKVKEILAKFSIDDSKFLLYVGAIQPRKNLKILIKAFDIYKQKTNSDIKLVLAGGKAWRWQETIKAIRKSSFQQDIILTGKISFDEVSVLYQNASLFIFPSLYEGFGIPILEALSAGVPILSANNSSLPEVGGNAVEYFDDSSPSNLAEKINNVLDNEKKRNEMIAKGIKQVQKFSWKKCAQETLEYLKS